MFARAADSLVSGRAVVCSGFAAGLHKCVNSLFTSQGLGFQPLESMSFGCRRHCHGPQGQRWLLLGGGPPCSAGMQPLRGASTAQCMVPADSALQCPQQQHWLAPAPASAARRARQPALRGTGATQRQPAPDAAAPGGAARRQRRLPAAQHQRRPSAMKTYQPVLVPARCQAALPVDPDATIGGSSKAGHQSVPNPSTL